ncbi:GerAB/ArcD/ProY family transporter [Paenibacillus sp. Marseille-Q4541]|uniref:GerAB/ArcD/ProY family transporter n=1 Tax=Paenibacillus sp. Marseille-Q4541 TaxID=2831522 RepID=UPI001BA95F6E|nr:GerAB/ArcD/ProY family transporter [Paenibacillus sp. Marseille-Q4541]
MKITYTPNKNVQFHAYLLVYIICAAQIGIGIFSFQRDIFGAAAHDAWISVIIAGLITHLAIWFIIRMLGNYESTDLYGIHHDLFGKYVGTMMNCIYMLYYLFITATFMRNYVEVIQAWIFPDIPLWLVMALLSGLAIYAAYGGIRVIIGICMLGFFVILPTSVLCYSALEYAVWTQLLPVWETSTWDILRGTMKMGYSLAGFEIILLVYPFILNKNRVMLHSQLGAAFTNIAYLLIMMISIVYFSPSQLQRSIWPSIIMLKIVKYPYLERLEFIVISLWMLVILAGILLFTWVITRGCKRMWNLNPKITLIFVLVVSFIFSVTVEKHFEIEKFNKWADIGSTIFAYLYPILLSCIVAIVFKVRQRKQLKEEGGTK